MFRIDRNLVKLTAARSITIEDEGTEAGAAGDNFPDAAAFAAAVEKENALAQAIQAHERDVEETLAKTREEAGEIIANAEARAKLDAEKIIEDAKNEAAAILLAAREEAEEERTRAKREGYAEGAAEGKSSYDEQLAEKLREDDEKLRRVIDELYSERAQTYEGLESEVVGLSMEIIRKIVDPSDEESMFFESMVRNALRQLNPDGKIILRVSPAEHERFFASGSAAFELGNGASVSASVIRDPSLKGGDCLIDADNTTTNAGLESQLKYVELAFKQA